jgi:hypothetical protein
MHSEAEIHGEIRACLRQCIADDMSPACLADSLTRLRNQGWNWDEIRRVQIAVLTVVSGVRRTPGPNENWPTDNQSGHSAGRSGP